MDHAAPHMSVRDQQTICCEGRWVLSYLEKLEQHLLAVDWPGAPVLTCDVAGITAMDTGGAVLLQRTLRGLEQRGKQVTLKGLRPEFAEIMRLVSTYVESPTLFVQAAPPGFLEVIGVHAWRRVLEWNRGLAFLGETTVSFLRSLWAPGTIRWRFLLQSLQVDGFHALPITGLLSFLMGIVIAYQGAEQLRTVGANIFVVDLVGISLLREIAPLVTAILVAGRSGSSYAAQIGTMRVTEELDAMRTLGLSPIHVLVLPKIVALVVALPLLTVYADVVGVFGGMLIAANQLGVGYHEFLTRFEEAIALKHFVIGIVKAPVFAGIIAIVGCHQGFEIRGGVEDVGHHTTISVVQSIFLVIVFDAVFSVVLSWMGV